MSSPRPAKSEHPAPQDIYNALFDLYKHKEKYEKGFFTKFIHKDITNEIEEARNIKLREVLRDIKTQLLTMPNNTIIVPSSSKKDEKQLGITQIPNNDDAYNIIKNNLVKLIATNINQTINLATHGHRSTEEIETIKKNIKLGKLHEHCIRLCPDAYIEFQWKNFIQNTSPQYTFSHEKLMAITDAKTKKLIESHPLFLALVNINKLDEQIENTIATLDNQSKKDALGIEPVNDLVLLQLANKLMQNLLKPEDKEWNQEIYTEFTHKFATTNEQLYPTTQETIASFNQFAAEADTIQALIKKYELSPDQQHHPKL